MNKVIKNYTIIGESDLSKFNPSPFQRNYRNLNKIIRSIEQEGYRYWEPIAVRRINFKGGRGYSLEIIDGHHRFKACQIVKSPIWYVIVEDVDFDIISANITKNLFNLKDYLVVHAKKGLPEYIALQKYITRTGMGVSEAVKVLCNLEPESGVGSVINEFKAGLYKATNLQNAETIAQLIETIKKHVVWGSQRFSVQALFLITKVKGFRFNRFCQKIDAHSFLLKKQGSKEAYLLMYEEIYNFHAQKDDRLQIALLALTK